MLLDEPESFEAPDVEPGSLVVGLDEPESFEPESFERESFEPESFEPESFDEPSEAGEVLEEPPRESVR